KTKPSLEGKTQPKSVASQCLPLVGSEAWKPLERRPASRSTDDGTVQAHPSMRICSYERRGQRLSSCFRLRLSPGSPALLLRSRNPLARRRGHIPLPAAIRVSWKRTRRFAARIKFADSLPQIRDCSVETVQFSPIPDQGRT